MMVFDGIPFFFLEIIDYFWTLLSFYDDIFSQMKDDVRSLKSYNAYVVNGEFDVKLIKFYPQQYLAL